jgi:hypothetical protein
VAPRRFCGVAFFGQCLLLDADGDPSSAIEVHLRSVTTARQIEKIIRQEGRR